MKRIAIASVLVALGSGTVLAADMAARMPMKAAPMMAPASSWQGFYLGGNVGYGWGSGDATVSGVPVFLEASTVNAKSLGVIGGGQIGYNWQINSLVMGLEADVQGSGIKGTTTKAPFTAPVASVVAGSSLPVDEQLSWFGTVRGHLGVAATPSLLLYATGGLAFGSVKDSTNVHFPAPLDIPASVATTKAGWTAGAGLEWMIAHNWSAKLEYLYVDLGSQSATASAAALAPGLHLDYTWKNQDHIVRVGANYHF